MRHAYGEKSVKIIALVRAPLARLRAAFAHYAHYAKAFGEGEDGFDAFVRRRVSAVRGGRKAEKRVPRRECLANVFGANGVRVSLRGARPRSREGVLSLRPAHQDHVRDVRARVGRGALARRTCRQAFPQTLNRATHFLGLHVGATDDVIQRMDACDGNERLRPRRGRDSGDARFRGGRRYARGARASASTRFSSPRRRSSPSCSATATRPLRGRRGGEGRRQKWVLRYSA